MLSVTGSTPADVYSTLMANVIKRGVRKNPRGKWTLDLHPVVTEVKSAAANKFLLIPNRGINYAFAMAEVLWILAGRGDYEFIGFYNTNMKKYLDDDKGLIDIKGMTTTHDFHASYGKRIRRANISENNYIGNLTADKFRGVEMNSEDWHKLLFQSSRPIDQLEMVYHKIQEDVNTRQAVVSMWDVKKDNFMRTKDYPCNTQLMFKVTDGVLDMSVMRRSNDIVWGYPYNMIQFTSIHEYMASWLGLAMGSMFEFIDSLHIYTEEYPALFEFFNTAVDKEQPYLFNSNNLVGVNASGYMNKATMDRFIKYFFETEKEWRSRITVLTHAEILKLYVDRWLGELQTLNATYYWQHVYTFLLAFHMYKSKHYEQVIQLMQRIPNPMFTVMALETFGDMKSMMLDAGLMDYKGIDKDAQELFVTSYGKVTNVTGDNVPKVRRK